MGGRFVGVTASETQSAGKAPCEIDWTRLRNRGVKRFNPAQQRTGLNSGLDSFPPDGENGQRQTIKWISLLVTVALFWINAIAVRPPAELPFES